jgi:hypothetical protein
VLLHHKFEEIKPCSQAALVFTVKINPTRQKKIGNDFGGFKS